MKMNRRVVSFLAGLVLVLSASAADAAFLPDDGTELFLPADVVISVEFADTFESATSTRFGFFYASDPGRSDRLFPRDRWRRESGYGRSHRLHGGEFERRRARPRFDSAV
jgi:hypothetical protein